MPEVGTTETVDVSIPLSSTARAQVFRWMNMSETLMHSLDDAVWLRQLTALRENLNDLQYSVVRGGLTLGVPTRQMNSYNISVDMLSPDIAENLVDAASNGCVSLDVVRVSDLHGNTYRLTPRSNLEDAAWRAFSGGTVISSLRQDDGITFGVSTHELQESMALYREFRTLFRTRYMREEIHRRLGQSSASTPEDNGRMAAQKRDENFRKYDKYSRTLRIAMKLEAAPFSVLPILPHKTLSSRRWGIEIEAVDIANVKTPDFWELKSDGSLRSLSDQDNENQIPSEDHSEYCPIYDYGYDSEDDDGYPHECDCDAQYESGGGSAYTEVGEWNSPVLRSFHSRGLEYLCSELENRRTNKSPGIHVHVEAADLTLDQTLKLTTMYTSFEPLFESAYFRDERSYCQPVDAREFFKRVDAANNVKKSGGTVRNLAFSSRYWSVNLASLRGKGTVEFRSMGPKYNYEHLVRWAYFCREMVNVARSDVKQREWSRVRTMADLVVLFSKYGKETPTPSWAKNVPARDVVAELGIETRRKPNKKNFSTATEHGGQFILTEVFEDYVGATQFVSHNEGLIRPDMF